MKLSADELLYMQETNGVIRIGLSEKAQDDLGNVTFVSLPKVGTKLKVGESFAEVEAEKAVNELVSPLKGEVVAIHSAAEENPELLDEKENPWLMDLKVEE